MPLDPQVRAYLDSIAAVPPLYPAAVVDTWAALAWHLAGVVDRVAGAYDDAAAAIRAAFA